MVQRSPPVRIVCCVLGDFGIWNVKGGEMLGKEMPETAAVICRKLNVYGEEVTIVDSCNGWAQCAPAVLFSVSQMHFAAFCRGCAVYAAVILWYASSFCSSARQRTAMSFALRAAAAQPRD